jgi:DNA-binding Xre family transcriptional regulator
LELKLEKIPVIVREMDDLEAHRLCVILNKDRGSPDYFKLSKLFNEDLERGLQQKDLAKRYGFAEGTISMLARVESDFLRWELVKRAREGNWSSNKIQDKATLCNKVLSHLRAKTQDEKLINQILEELVEEIFTYPESRRSIRL